MKLTSNADRNSVGVCTTAAVLSGDDHPDQVLFDSICSYRRPEGALVSQVLSASIFASDQEYCRIPVFIFGGVLMLISGVSYLGIVLATKQINEHGTNVDFVWPPDEADCNKIPLLCSAMLRVRCGLSLSAARY